MSSDRSGIAQVSIAIPSAGGGGRFARNVLTLASGTALAQLATVLATPVLSRLYGPEAFGVLGVLLAVAAPLGAIAGLKYELAIVIENRLASALDALRLVFLSSLLWAALLLCLVIIGGDSLSIALGIPGQSGLLMLVPVLVFLGGATTGLSLWQTRQARWRRQSMSEINRNLGTILGQLTLSLVHNGGASLLIGRLFGEAAMLVYLMTGRASRLFVWRSKWRATMRYRAMTAWKRLRKTAHRHREIAIYQTPCALINSSLTHMPTLLLAAVASPAVAGFYWFTTRLLRMPTALVGNAIRRVFFKSAVSLRSHGTSEQPLFWRLTLLLLLIGAVPMVVLMLWGGPLFALIFGEAWREAGHLARWLGLWTWLELAAAPSRMLVVLCNLQRAFFRADVLVGSLGITALLVIAASGRIELAIGVYAGAMGLRCLYGIVVVAMRLRREARA